MKSSYKVNGYFKFIGAAALGGVWEIVIAKSYVTDPQILNQVMLYIVALETEVGVPVIVPVSLSKKMPRGRDGVGVKRKPFVTDTTGVVVTVKGDMSTPWARTMEDRPE